MTPLIHHDRKAIAWWLAICALLVFGMVFIGGYTRLSGSGLSITEWKPLHGTIPPLNQAQWEEEFAAYKESPQYQKVNHGMVLDEFRTIFWPEFIHRLLARGIGVVFFLPLLVFVARRSLSRRFGVRLAGIFLLGGLQGIIGWLMVKSGLVNDPHVSHFRLALHLSVALLILGLLTWALMDVLYESYAKAKDKGNSFRYLRVRNSYLFWFLALCLQIILGALVAGLHAGLIYNTWPDMNGGFLPSVDHIDLNQVGYSPDIVQFLHRRVAEIVAFGFLFWWYCNRGYVRKTALGKRCAAVAAVIGLQFTLGVLTLLHSAPLPLALAHQMMAVVLYLLAVILLYSLYQGKHQPNDQLRTILSAKH